jgi:hypothetical protein
MSFLDSVERAHYSDTRYCLIQIPGYASKRVSCLGSWLMVLTPVKTLPGARVRADQDARAKLDREPLDITVWMKERHSDRRHAA